MLRVHPPFFRLFLFKISQLGAGHQLILRLGIWLEIRNLYNLL